MGKLADLFGNSNKGFDLDELLGGAKASPSTPKRFQQQNLSTFKPTVKEEEEKGVFSRVLSPALKSGVESTKAAGLRGLDFFSRPLSQHAENLIADTGGKTTTQKMFDLENRVAGKDLTDTTAYESFQDTQDFRQKQASGIEQKSQEIASTIAPKNVVEERAGKIVQAIPSASQSLLGPVGVGAMALEAFGSKYGQAKESGSTELQAMGAGALSAGLEGATEAIPAKALANVLKGAKPLKSAMIEVVSETLGEGVSGALDPLIDKLTFNKDQEIELAQMWYDFKDQGLTGGSIAILMAGFGGGVASITRALNNPTTENIEQVKTEVEDLTGQTIPDLQLQQAVQEAKDPQRLELPQLDEGTFAQKPKFTTEQAQPTTIEEQANIMLGELQQSQRGDKTGDGDGGTVFQNRQTNDIFIPLLDGTSGARSSKMKYAEIETAMNRIINGKPDTKTTTYIREKLQEQIDNGYETLEGIDTANIEYTFDDLAQHVETLPTDIAQSVIKEVSNGNMTINEAMEVTGVESPSPQTQAIFDEMTPQPSAEAQSIFDKVGPSKNVQSIFDEVGNTEASITQQLEAITSRDIKTVEQAEQAIAEVEELSQRGGKLKMNLQMFADAKDTIRSLIAQARMGMGQLDGEETPLAFPQGRMEDLSATAQEYIDANPMTSKSITNEQTLEKANELVEQYPQASEEIISSGDVYNNALETTVGMRVIEDTFQQAKTNDSLYDKAFRLMEEHAKKLKNMGQSIQSAAMWARTTPEGMVKQLDRVLEDAKKRGYSVDDNPALKKEVYTDMQAIQSMGNTQDAVDYINELHNRQTGKDVSKRSMEHLSKQTLQDLQTIATNQVLNKVMDVVDISFWQKVSTYQAMSHLLNTKTALRNVLSNLSMNDAERLSNTLGIPLDILISKKTGQRSVVMPQAKKEGIGVAKEMMTDAATKIELGLPIGDNKYGVSQTFKKGLLSKGEKILRYELQASDEGQKGLIKSDLTDQFERMNNGKPVTEEQQAIIDDEMRFRTFQDDTLASTFLSKIKDDMNRFGMGKQRPGTGVDVGGKQMFGVREFGLGDFLLKYSKVPGNIITRKIEYSPFGYIKALHNMANITDQASQRKAVMSMARATTGTMMVGMGALMKKLGLIIREEDEEATGLKALKKSAGLGNYKFNVSGAGRLLTGGDPTLQDGDKLVTYGWIEPIGSSFTVGASIYDAINDGEDVSGIALGALNQTMEESLDISTLGTIKSMTYGQNPLEVAVIPFASGASGFVPSALRQTSSVIDPTMRQKYTGGPLERAGKQIVGATPLSPVLEPYLSPTGEERSNNTGLLGNMLSQFSPATVTEYTPQAILEPLIKLDDATDKEIPYPSTKAPNTLTVNGEVITLTDKQKTEYLKAKGEYTAKEYEKVLKGINFNSLTDSKIESTLSKLTKIKSKSTTIGKEAID